MSRALFLVLAGVLIASCASQSAMRAAVFKRAAFDLDCDAAKLEAVELNRTPGGYHRAFGVQGCEKRATYTVSGDALNGYTVKLGTPAKQ
jgi:hypothetical protein